MYDRLFANKPRPDGQPGRTPELNSKNLSLCYAFHALVCLDVMNFHGKRCIMDALLTFFILKKCSLHLAPK